MFQVLFDFYTDLFSIATFRQPSRKGHRDAEHAGPKEASEEAGGTRPHCPVEAQSPPERTVKHGWADQDQVSQALFPRG